MLFVLEAELACFQGSIAQPPSLSSEFGALSGSKLIPNKCCLKTKQK